MDTELADFEKRMQKELYAFFEPSSQRGKSAQRSTSIPTFKPEKQDAKAMKTGHIVKLAVRTKQLEMDSVFEYHSSSISKLEAQIEAERVARKASYPIIGYVVDIKRF
ncbi:hypothetical protein [Billgrantia endophytica]|uniref:Uncharacterized protein n=1 Tax=Billgrantia endophytica TaxID=2033802 RepID=A0A2N7U4F6_9GAMM|nr:hypothetical protein [Halomonas endophytica]PMR75309.1 hypothetical protein C1H69_10320 [Halomonas endophytica]